MKKFIVILAIMNFTLILWSIVNFIDMKHIADLEKGQVEQVKFDQLVIATFKFDNKLINGCFNTMKLR